MIRAVYKDGLIYPAEPIPPEWADGQPVTVEPALSNGEPSDDPAEIDRWDARCREVGFFDFEPGEEERFQAALDEADRIAREFVRRRMESGR